MRASAMCELIILNFLNRRRILLPRAQIPSEAEDFEFYDFGTLLCVIVLRAATLPLMMLTSAIPEILI